MVQYKKDDYETTVAKIHQVRRISDEEKLFLEDEKRRVHNHRVITIFALLANAIIIAAFVNYLFLKYKCEHGTEKFFIDAKCMTVLSVDKN